MSPTRLSPRVFVGLYRGAAFPSFAAAAAQVFTSVLTSGEVVVAGVGVAAASAGVAAAVSAIANPMPVAINLALQIVEDLSAETVGLVGEFECMAKGSAQAGAGVRARGLG